MKKIFLLILLAIALSACGDQSPTTTTMSEPAPAPHHEIIYNHPLRDGFGTEIIRSSSDGTNRKVVIDTGRLLAAPVAGRILYQARSVWDDIYVASVDGSGRRLVRAADYSTYTHTAAISPDGEWFVSVDLNNETGPRVTIQRIDGTERRTLVSDPYSGTSANFSPDGRKIAFLASDNRVSTINVDGTGRVAITPRPEWTTRGESGIGWSPEWSPTGEWIAIESFADETIDIVRADGGSPASLPSFRGAYPSWSPDGKEISCIDGKWIVIHPLSGKSRGIASNDYSLPGYNNPSWSADQRRLLINRRSLGTLDIARGEFSVIDENVFEAYWLR